MQGPSAESLEAELRAQLNVLRKNPASYASFLRSDRQNLYKGTELELLKDDLKTRVLLATKDGRKACLAAITALDKAKGLNEFDFRRGLDSVAADTADEIAKTAGISTSLPLMTLLQKYASVKSSAKSEFHADRIVVFGPDLYTAKNIVANLLINDGVPDAKARNVLLGNAFSFCGVAVRRHPVHDYVVVLAVCTPMYEDK